MSRDHNCAPESRASPSGASLLSAPPPSETDKVILERSRPMAKDNTITFYDLALSTGATISPFVWATKYALKHKGFDLEVVPGGFTGIPERTGGMTERLPAIVDDGEWVLDSWGIVEYLDEKYPDRPDADPPPERRHRHPRARRLVLGRRDRSVDALQLRQLPRPRRMPRTTNTSPIRAKRCSARRSRRCRKATRIGCRRSRAALEPLRIALREGKCLGGDTPNYADYRILGSILFTASVCRNSRCWPTTTAAPVDRQPARHVRRARPPSRAVQPVRARAARGRSAAVHAAGLGGIHKRNTGPRIEPAPKPSGSPKA